MSLNQKISTDDDKDENDNFDKDNPVKLSRLNWNIEESKWIKDASSN